MLNSRTIRLFNKGTTPVRLHAQYEPITSVPGVSFQVTPPHVALPPGGSALVSVQLRISNPAALRKAPDPTVALDDGHPILGLGLAGDGQQDDSEHERPKVGACHALSLSWARPRGNATAQLCRAMATTTATSTSRATSATFHQLIGYSPAMRPV